MNCECTSNQCEPCRVWPHTEDEPGEGLFQFAQVTMCASCAANAQWRTNYLAQPLTPVMLVDFEMAAIAVGTALMNAYWRIVLGHLLVTAFEGLPPPLEPKKDG